MVHFGCQLVMGSLYDLLAGFDVIGTVHLDDARANNINHDLLKRADLVIANGEGSYHHNRRPDFARIAKKYPTALINTVFQANDDDLSRFKYIAARESRSREEIAQRADCDLVPDVIFASRYLEGVKPTEGGRVVNVQHEHRNREPIVGTLQAAENVVPAIASASLVTTGSFHGACVAAYYGKPLKMTPSNTHKMEGLAADLGIGFGQEAHETPRAAYVATAMDRIGHMIETLKTL